MEGKTVSQIAHEIGTNRHVIYRIIKKLNCSPVDCSQTDTNGASGTEQGANNPLRYGASEVERIRDTYAIMQANKPTETDSKTASSKNEHREEITSSVQILEERVKNREEMLAYKDETIADLRRQLEEKQRQADSLQAANAKQLETIQELTAAIRDAQETQRGQMLMLAATKPKLLDRIKAHFQKTE